MLSHSINHLCFFFFFFLFFCHFSFILFVVYNIYISMIVGTPLVFSLSYRSTAKHQCFCCCCCFVRFFCYFREHFKYLHCVFEYFMAIFFLLRNSVDRKKTKKTKKKDIYTFRHVFIY